MSGEDGESFAVLCMLSTAAVAEGPKAGGVVNAVIQPEPPSLMVGLVQNGPTQMVAGNIYEGLLRYSPKLDPLPGLAESWTVSADGKIHFKLVKGHTARRQTVHIGGVRSRQFSSRPTTRPQQIWPSSTGQRRMIHGRLR
jgi:hypothetical protein